MKVVYFIRAAGIERSPVKIGCSTEPEMRKAALQNWHPYKLEVAATMPGGLELEGRFHAKFLAQQSHLEWFHWSQELEDVIEAIHDGIFDIETLPGRIDLRRLAGNYPTGPLTAEEKDRRYGYRKAVSA